MRNPIKNNNTADFLEIFSASECISCHVWYNLKKRFLPLFFLIDSANCGYRFVCTFFIFSFHGGRLMVVYLVTINVLC